MVSNEERQSRENDLTNIINSTSSELASLSEQTKDYLFSLVENGLLEQYQSRGRIELWTTELLKKLRAGGEENTT